jgi:exonuclease III
MYVYACIGRYKKQKTSSSNGTRIGLADHADPAAVIRSRPSTSSFTSRMNECTEREKERAFTPRHVKIATYNVRTLCNDGEIDKGKLFQLEKGCKKHNIDIVVLQEHRNQIEEDTDILDTEQGSLLLSSASEMSVGIYIRGRLKQLLIDHVRVSDRILVAYLDTNPQLVLIAVYAPTECADDDTKDAFYDELTTALDLIEPHCLILTAGDFNARVGHDSYESSPSAVESHLYHKETNENGTRLVSLCQHANLKMTQSYFQHRPGRLWSWTHPGGNHHLAQLDHITISSKWKNSLRNCRAYSTVNLQSDHRIVVSSLRLSLRTLAKAKAPPTPLWRSLDDQNRRQLFQIELENRFAALNNTNESASLQDRYNGFLESLSRAAENSLGVAKRTKEKRPWVSDETCALIDKRDAAKIKYEATHRKDAARAERKTEWDRLAAETNNALQADEMRHLEDELQAMQAAALSGHSRTAWSRIKKICGKQRKPPVKVKSKVKINETENELLSEWRSYFKVLLNAPVNPDTLNAIPPPDTHKHSSQVGASIRTRLAYSAFFWLLSTQSKVLKILILYTRSRVIQNTR